MNAALNRFKKMLHFLSHSSAWMKSELIPGISANLQILPRVSNSHSFSHGSYRAGTRFRVGDNCRRKKLPSHTSVS
jgi:hypothetical protein